MIKKFSSWLRKTSNKIRWGIWIRVSDTMLWIDERLNHEWFESLVVDNYELWEKTSYRYCLWTCDHFERFEK